MLVRLGVRRSNIFAAMLMSYLVSVTCIWTYLVATTPLVFLRSRAMVYFLISGCLQPLFARALFYEGITRIGVARAGPLRGAEPLFATIIAVVLLHERPGIMVYLGTALIMGSLWLISGSQGGAAKWRLVDAALPLGAGLVSAISQTLRKEGLKILPNPFVATAIVTSTSLALLISFILLTKRVNLLRMPRHRGFRSAAFGDIAGGRIDKSVVRGRVPSHPVILSIFCAIPIIKRDGIRVRQRFDFSQRRLDVVGMNKVGIGSRQHLFRSVTKDAFPC